MGLALAAMVAGIGLNAVGQNQALEAQSGVANAERGRQQGFNRQSTAALAPLLADQSPGARGADLASRSGALAAPQQDAASTIAAAAGNVSKGAAGAPQGQISQATQGEGQAGINRAALSAMLQAPGQQLQDQSQLGRTVAVNRRGIGQAAQRSTQPLGLEMNAAGYHGQALRQIAQLLMLGGQAGFSSGLSGAGGGASGSVAPTTGAAAGAGQMPTYDWASHAPGVT